MDERIRVGVIFGGRSGEHEVSLLSARSVIDALDPDKYEVVPIAISHEGHWLALDDARLALEQGVEKARGMRAALLAEPQERGLVPLTDNGVAVSDERKKALDVVFPVLHGTYGEDGTVQGLLELAGLPYVGAGVAGSAVGMDKALMKDIFQSHDFPIPPHIVFLRTEWERDPATIEQRVEERLGFPSFVKPANLGSSVGITKAHTRADLGRAIEQAAQYDRKIVVEIAVSKARELECAVLGNDDAEASVVGEIVPSNEFYDYEAKYVKNDSKLLIPAPISAELSDQIRELSKRAFASLDLSGLARVDFLLDGVNGQLYLNEVNTMPGFTNISMYPKLWEASGVGYGELVDRLIGLALERHHEKSRTRYTFTLR